MQSGNSAVVGDVAVASCSDNLRGQKLPQNWPNFFESLFDIPRYKENRINQQQRSKKKWGKENKKI